MTIPGGFRGSRRRKCHLDRCDEVSASHKHTLTPFFQSICGPPSFSSGSSNTEGIFLKLKCFMCILVSLSFWSPPFTSPVFPGGSAVKNLPAVQEMQVRSLDQEDPLEKEMATQVFLPGESHGQRSLVGCSP